MNQDSAESLCGDVIHAYSRAQAIADGVLIDVTLKAQQAGFCLPVAVTNAVWESCVAWTDEDSQRQTVQDMDGRLWDLVYKGANAIEHCYEPVDRLIYRFYRIPRDGWSKTEELVTVKMVIGPGDQGEPVITILMPFED